MLLIALFASLVTGWSNSFFGDPGAMRDVAKMLGNSMQQGGRASQHREADEKTGAAEAPTGDAYLQMKYSVVRFTTEVDMRSLLKPWQQSGRAVFAGTGFVIRNDKTRGPLIVTNAHVVTDATRVSIQIPAFGSQEYRSRVVLLNPDMDIALVELQEGEHEKLRKDIGKDLTVLEFYEEPVTLATPVQALGFPLGQKSVKFTTGVVSGHEKVGDYMSYQATASISPGNSGGPLVVAGTQQVLGINFAAAVGNASQQNNYAIPIWHVNQMLSEYDESLASAEKLEGSDAYSQELCRAEHKSCVYKVPKIKAMAALGNEALFQRFGCDHGVFLTRWGNASLFAFSDPPLPERVFVQEVAGHKLDEFGMARTSSYFEDPVRFDDLFFLSSKMGPVEVKVCSCGKYTTHKIETSGLKCHVPKSTITTLVEPNVFISTHQVYEHFGGITVQPLTMNLIKAFLEARQVGLVKYAMAEPKNPLLVVTAVSPFGTDRATTITPGDIVRSVNGNNVTTIGEFRKHFVPTRAASRCEGHETSMLQGASPLLWSLETDTGKEIVLDWEHAKKIQETAVANGEFPLTEAVKDAIGSTRKLGLSFSEQQTIETPEVLPIEMRDVPRFGDKAWNALKAFDDMQGIAI